MVWIFIIQFFVFINADIENFDALEPLLEKLENSLALPATNEYEIWDQKEMDVKLKPFREKFVDKKTMFSRKSIYQGKQTVPNIVHYIWFGCDYKRSTMDTLQFLSMLSAYLILNPKHLLFHADCQPKGPYFDLISRLPVFRFILTEAPTTVHNRPVKNPAHQSDVLRLRLLRQYGGIYLDDTEIVTKPFTELMKYDMTLPHQSNGTLQNGVIVARPESAFLRRWYLYGYKDFDDKRWGWNSCIQPYKLDTQFPGKLHVEKNTFMPIWDQYNVLWDNTDKTYTEKGGYPWKDIGNYAVHIYNKQSKKPVKNNLHEILRQDNTVGELARFVIEKALSK